MLRKVCMRVTIAIAAAVGPAAPVTAATIQHIVAQVSQSSYTDYLDNWLYTRDGHNRGPAGAEHDLARDNILAAFTSFGLSASLDPFTYNEQTYHNVVGVHTGAVRPEEIYIVGAHYDSASNPGADDNASGVAAVMEAARVLSQYAFESTLVFIAFDMEERGGRGGWAYANAHAGDDILGMISLDMIAYNPAGADQDRVHVCYDIHVSSPPQITADLADAMAEYSGGLSTVIAEIGDVSDHAAFAHNGFDAALLIEYNWRVNPHFHKLTDSVDTADYIDYQYATRVTRGTVGYLATAAGHVPEPGSLALTGSGILVLGLLLLRRRGRPVRVTRTRGCATAPA